MVSKGEKIDCEQERQDIEKENKNTVRIFYPLSPQYVNDKVFIFNKRNKMVRYRYDSCISIMRMPYYSYSS